MRRRHLLVAMLPAAVALAVALAPVTAVAAAAGEEVFEADERMIEANALLGDRSQYPRAIALYRAVLREHPDNGTARLWLARVLSWQGEHGQALAEYDRLLAADPPPAEDLEIERAEVLSWAGRYDEALAAFDRILAEDPDEQRAVLGKARVYRWSGRRSEAAQSYRQALVLRDDDTVRDELGELRKSLGAGGDAQGQYAYDSDGFYRATVGSTASVDLGFATRFVGQMSFDRVGRDGAPLVVAAGAPTASNGLSALLGLEQSLGASVVATAQLGYSWWEQAPGQLLARGRLEASLPTGTALGLQLDHGAFLDWSGSYEAVLAGIDGTNLRGTVWHGLAERWGAFGYVETTFVGDGNQRIAAGASTDYQPFRSVDLMLGLGLDYLTYTGRSLLYYDPSIDVGGSAIARIEQPLGEQVAVFAEATCGLGFAEQAGRDGFGLTYGVSGGLRVERGGLSLSVHGGRSQSQRASVYTSYAFGASLDLRF